MNVKEIKQILQLLRDFEIAEFELEREGCRLSLKKQSSIPAHENKHSPLNAQALIQGLIPQPIPRIDTLSTATVVEKTEPKPEIILHSIVSPIVGTFYISNSPEAAPFVTVGARITPQDTVCIIEAMKVMNEIKADVSGIIEETLVTNGQIVEFGQVLFKVRI
jgi:acetyl-CoA carboxylase biotin carboxyl carrier protein